MLDTVFLRFTYLISVFTFTFAVPHHPRDDASPRSVFINFNNDFVEELSTRPVGTPRDTNNQPQLIRFYSWNLLNSSARPDKDLTFPIPSFVSFKGVRARSPPKTAATFFAVEIRMGKVNFDDEAVQTTSFSLPSDDPIYKSFDLSKLYLGTAARSRLFPVALATEGEIIFTGKKADGGEDIVMDFKHNSITVEPVDSENLVLVDFMGKFVGLNKVLVKVTSLRVPALYSSRILVVVEIDDFWAVLNSR